MLNEEALAQIPTEYTPEIWTMNPETEGLLRGSEIENGMVVHIEGQSFTRNDPSAHALGVDHECDKYKCARLDVDQRWCVVTDVQFKNGLLSFVGVYSDGVLASRTYNTSWFWYVKKENVNA